MKIKIKREGGFIGITSKADLDYDDLTESEQNALNSLAEQSMKSTSKNAGDKITATDSTTAADTSPNGENKKSKPNTRGLDANATSTSTNGLELAGNDIPRNNKSGMSRDAFSYSISMKKDGKNVSMTFDDTTAPPEIVQIFQKYVHY